MRPHRALLLSTLSLASLPFATRAAHAAHQHHHHHHHHHHHGASDTPVVTTPVPTRAPAPRPPTDAVPTRTTTATAPVPDRTPAPRALAAHAVSTDPPARSATRENANTETTTETTRAPVNAPTPLPAPAPAVTPPPVSAPSGCVAASAPWRVEVAPASSRMMQVALAARGNEALALVTLAHNNRDPRDGLAFGDARIVHVTGDGPRAVMIAPSVEPDAALTWSPTGTVLVTSYTHPNLRGDMMTSLRALMTTSFTLPESGQGRVERVATHLLEGTLGWTFESRPVVRGEGFAALMATVPDGRGTRLQWATFDRAGEIRSGASDVAMESSSASVVLGGRFRASLMPGASRDAAAWIGAEGGVWLRTRSDNAWQPPVHRAIADVWNAEVADNGAGVFLRTEGDRGEPAVLRWLGWDDTTPVTLGRGWDVLAVTARGHVIAAGLTRDGTEGGELGSAPIGHALEPLVLPDGVQRSLAHAVDLDMVATDTGALLAWIEPMESSARPVRHLSLLRVTCTPTR